MAKKEIIVQMIDTNVNEIEKLIHQKTEIWSTHVVFSNLWWFGVVLSIVPWIIWSIIRKKESSDRLLFVGFFVMTLSLILDVLGDQWGLWHYRFNVIPVLPTYAPWDITLMPVTVMLLLQYKPKANPFLKAIIFALLTSYVAEPFIEWLQIYDPKNWRYSYSVPIQFFIFISAYYISKRNGFAKLDS